MDFEDAFFDTNDFELIEKLGEGKFGIVFKAQRILDQKLFAAKIIKSQGVMNGLAQQKFLLEAQILNKLNHPAIVKFHGINFHSFKDPTKFEPAILTQYMENGSLEDIIKKEKNNSVDPKWNATKKYICFLGIAHAMDYLHKNRVIHRDLKPLNVLMDKDFYPYVCDFGISKCISKENSRTIQMEDTDECGTFAYMAPELFDSNVVYGASVDVYAFAITVNQILSGNYLVPGKNFYVIMKKIKSGERPTIDTSKVSPKMEDLIKRCWSQKSYERPSFAEIFNLLSNDFDYSKDKIDIQEVNKYINRIKESMQTEIKDSISNDALTKLLVNLDDYEYDKEKDKIGSGRISTVYKATLKGDKSINYTIKEIILDQQQDIQQEFLRPNEIQSSLKHPAILELKGFSLPSIYEDKSKISRNYFAVVTDYPPNGSLHSLLVKVRADQAPENYETIKAKIIFGIAAGMAFIHQNDIVLSDLRPESVFLDANYSPKIGGFVNAINLRKGSSSHSREALKGIPFYMAPELLNTVDHLPYNHKVDVYAFGMVLFEIFSKKEEIQNLINRVMEMKERPMIESNSTIPAIYKDLINKCWNADPEKRPTFLSIVQRFLNSKNDYFNMQLIDTTVFGDYINTVKENLAFW